MTDAAPTILICRPADLAILAATVSGVENVPTTAEGGIRWRAGPDARVRLTFPPQAIAETLLGETLLGEPAMADARLSGPSVLEFAIDAGTEIEGTAEGILRAVAEAGRLRPSATIGGEGSVVEMPWGLLGSPTPAWSDEPVMSDHLPGPLASPDGVVGLWQARLHAEHGIAFRPLLPLSDQMPADTALSGDQRRKIVDAGGRQPSVPSDLVLSALGGSASFRLEARDITWSHDVALGRDARVRVVSHGMLYPFGHRAVLVEAAERQMTDDGPGAVAGVQRTIMRIVLTERVRRVARSDFPFDAVEILADVIDFEGHGARLLRRVPDATGPLQTRRAEAQGLASTLLDQLREYLTTVPRTPTIEWAAEQGNAAAVAYVQTLAAIDDLTTQLENTTSGDTADFLRAELARTRATLAALYPAAKAAEAAAAYPHSVQDLYALQDPSAVQYVGLEAEIADLDTRIAAGQAASQQDREVAFLALAADGSPVPVPVRCQGRCGPVDFALPMMFVDDFTWRSDVDGADFESLRDASTVDGLRGAWAPYANTALPGVAIDLVRRAPAQPGDVHEVCALQLASAGYDPEIAAYAPRLTQVDVRLRAWRTLLPGQGDRVALAYPTTPSSADVALDIVPPAALDFTGRADRAGGLAVPKLAVDGISRSLGPVPKGALPGASAEALRRIYADTTVLGFSLGDILAAPAAGMFPQPPAMIPLQGLGGSAGVRFEWRGLPLRGNGVFRTPAPGEPGAGDPSTLDVVATVAPDHSETRCTLTRFGLVLPPVAPVVQLDFAALTCRTTPGRPPSVDIDGLTVTFLGPLKLLNGLQERLQSAIRGTGVTLERTPDGIRAGYAVSIPDVAAGAFQLQNVDASVVVDVPFTGRRVSVTLAFARPDNPFRLAVLAFGGGGYAVVEIAGDTVARVDVSLDFGAFLAVDFKIASAEVHVVGGVSITGDGDGVLLVAFLRMGGSIQLLGVVSVSVEFKLLLAYDNENGANRLVGRARLVVEVDLLFFSKSLELDTGEWVIAGGSGPVVTDRGTPTPARARIAGPDARFAFGPPGLFPTPADLATPDVGVASDPDDAGRASWVAYQLAFAEEPVA